MNEALPAVEFQRQERVAFGFWVYLMTDLISFAALFAAFSVLRGSTFGGPGGADLFNLPFVFAETMLLLVSSFTCGLAVLAAEQNKQPQALIWLAVTFLLGGGFLALELNEFSRLVAEGNGPQRSAFLSAFFALVGTHGLHIAVGLLWMAVVMLVIWRRGLSSKNFSNLVRLGLFWHFLDIVWIFIFTIVYLLGVL